VCLAWSAPAIAHKASDSYLALQLDGTRLSGQWDIALRDLDLVLDLDQDRNGAIDWGEVRRRHPDIAAYALAHLDLTTGSASSARCALSVMAHQIDRHSDGHYAVLKLGGECPGGADTVTLKYSLLFDQDAQHRGLLKLSRGSAADGGAPDVISAVFPIDNATQSFRLAATDGTLRRFATYVADGIKHIAIGFDHILFLVALLLPAVLVRKPDGWVPVQQPRAALWAVFGIVSAFTVAHSITLSLAVLDVVQLPSRWVETGIAASVLLTAVDNLWPFLPRRRWMVAFAFGLLHGFGFAAVLLDLKLPAGALLLSLSGFNLGVEIGQLLIVSLLMPLAYVTRQRIGYLRFALRTGSVVIAAVATGWMLERGLNLQLMPF